MSAQSVDELIKRYPKLFRLVGTPSCIEVAPPKGWLKLLDRLCEMLVELTPPGSDQPAVVQVKEKFGGLRFYVDCWLTDEQSDAITEAEAESYRTCESCGAPGRARDTGWVTTLCDDCHDRRRPNGGS